MDAKEEILMRNGFMDGDDEIVSLESACIGPSRSVKGRGKRDCEENNLIENGFILTMGRDKFPVVIVDEELEGSEDDMKVLDKESI